MRQREGTGRTGRKQKKGKVNQKEEEIMRGEQVRDELETAAGDDKSGGERVRELMKTVANLLMKVQGQEMANLRMIEDMKELRNRSVQAEKTIKRCRKRMLALRRDVRRWRSEGVWRRQIRKERERDM